MDMNVEVDALLLVVGVALILGSDGCCISIMRYWLAGKYRCMACQLIYYVIMNISSTTKVSQMKVEKGEVKATFRIPVDTMKKLKYKAIDENTSVNSLVIKALTELLKK